MSLKSKEYGFKCWMRTDNDVFFVQARTQFDN